MITQGYMKQLNCISASCLCILNLLLSIIYTDASVSLFFFLFFRLPFFKNGHCHHSVIVIQQPLLHFVSEVNSLSVGST